MHLTPIKELLIGTWNSGKIEEITHVLQGLPVKLHRLEEFANISTPEECGESYAENASIKARAYAQQTGLLSLADDSGLEVAVLNGAPGVRSARFGGDGISDAERTRLLLNRLEGVADQQLRAKFVCVVAVAEPGGAIINLETGTCEGRITNQPVGDGGFGYDPIFIPEGYELTFAQMPHSLKNQISHRAKALIATRRFLSGACLVES